MIEFARCNMAYEFILLSALIHPERDKMSGSHAVVRTAGEKEKKHRKRSKNVHPSPASPILSAPLSPIVQPVYNQLRRQRGGCKYYPLLTYK